LYSRPPGDAALSRGCYATRTAAIAASEDARTAARAGVIIESDVCRCDAMRCAKMGRALEASYINTFILGERVE
jgi:hypothetical protein